MTTITINDTIYKEGDIIQNKIWSYTSNWFKIIGFDTDNKKMIVKKTKQIGFDEHYYPLNQVRGHRFKIPYDDYKIYNGEGIHQSNI